jgi:DNA-binding CsgD family transcriptional regulator
LELFEQISLKEATSGALYVTALVDARLGRVERARAAAERALALSEDQKNWIFTLLNQSVLGFLELSLGDAPAAARRLASVHDPLGELSNSGILPNAIEALVAVGELGEARRLLERLEERGRTLDRAWALATGARCRGLLAAAEGDLPLAFAAFERALAEHERLPDPFERGRTLLALGQTRRRAKQKRAARASLEQALAVFEELGAPLWAEKARVELGRIGGRAVPRRGQLTATEQAIADLVAAGRTNQEVAAALSLSPRTVQWNLSKIYRKIGVRTRTELAAGLAGADDARGR